MHLLFTLILTFTFTASALAVSRTTLEERIPPDLFKGGNNSFLTLTLENDLFGAGTDKNYTSGVRLTYFNAAQKPGPVLHWLDDNVPMVNINQTTSVYYSLGQNLYTPDDITQAQPQPNDRPWAGFLYGAVGMTSLIDNHVDDIELTAGVVGPAALGEPIQKFIHRQIGAEKPEGWDNQIKNEPGLMLAWRRRWPDTFSLTTDELAFSMEPNLGATVGNIYTLAETGLTFRLTPRDDQWQDTPLHVRPSLPGSGFFRPHRNRLGWMLFAGLQGRGVLQNIFLDGNTFTDSPHAEKNHFVMDANAGVALTYGNFRLSYTAVYRTEEFENQDNAALFGGISVGYRF